VVVKFRKIIMNINELDGVIYLNFPRTSVLEIQLLTEHAILKAFLPTLLLGFFSRERSELWGGNYNGVSLGEAQEQTLGANDSITK